MFFLIRSALWLAVVGALMPTDSIGSTPYLSKVQLNNSQIFGQMMIDKVSTSAGQTTQHICENNMKLCSQSKAALDDMTTSVHSAADTAKQNFLAHTLSKLSF